MSGPEYENFNPTEARDFRMPESTLESTPISDSDSEVLTRLREEASQLLRKAPDDLTASELGVILLASQSAQIVQENRDLKMYVAKLEEERDTDSVTEFKNRRYLQRLLEQSQATATERAQERRLPKEGEPATAVLVIDLNGFKHINDEYGHAAGDNALYSVARAIREALRSEDEAVALRSGGDEFIVLLHNILPSDVESAANRIHDAIAAVLFADTNRHGVVAAESISASIGVKMHLPGNSLQKDIEEADQAMYAAKAKKGNEEGARTVAIAPDFAQEVAVAQEIAAEEADAEAEPA